MSPQNRLRRLSHLLQAAALQTAIAGLQRLTPTQSSNLGARIARSIGLRLAVSETANSNLRHAFPNLSNPQRVPQIAVGGLGDS